MTDKRKVAAALAGIKMGFPPNDGGRRRLGSVPRLRGLLTNASSSARQKKNHGRSTEVNEVSLGIKAKNLVQSLVQFSLSHWPRHPWDLLLVQLIQGMDKLCFDLFVSQFRSLKLQLREVIKSPHFSFCAAPKHGHQLPIKIDCNGYVQLKLISGKG